MKISNKTTLRAGVVAMAIMAVSTLTLSACGDGEHDHADDAANHMENATEAVEEMADEAANTMEAAADSLKTDMDEMNSLNADLNFADGTMEKSLMDFIANGSGTQTFVLDKIPFEGEEVSAEGAEQLDHLAAIFKANPDLRAEVQGHTSEAKNAVGRTAKKTASATRAAWVKTKLVFRGVEGKQLDAKGYADEQLLEGIAPDADEQKRLVIALTK
ncbi:MAG: OmpA family protein [Flavobacteriales bacterium]|nr:OmpA family protein [Flavobacteriales bacterium]